MSLGIGSDFRSVGGRDSVRRGAGTVKAGQEILFYSLSLKVRLLHSNIRRKLRGFAAQSLASESLKSQPSMNSLVFLWGDFDREAVLVVEKPTWPPGLDPRHHRRSHRPLLGVAAAQLGTETGALSSTTWGKKARRWWKERHFEGTSVSFHDAARKEFKQC